MRRIILALLLVIAVALALFFSLPDTSQADIIPSGYGYGYWDD